jgi:hypothetical protein
MRIWKRSKKGEGFSKTKLLLGAGGLLLFIIGLKRSHRLDNDTGVELVDAVANRWGSEPQAPEGKTVWCELSARESTRC